MEKEDDDDQLQVDGLNHSGSGCPVGKPEGSIWDRSISVVVKG